MRQVATTTLLALGLVATVLVPAGAQAEPPAECDADVPALEEGERYATRTLWFHTTGVVADLDALTGGEPTMDGRRPLDNQAAYDLMADSRDADLADPAAAHWRYAMPAAERIVCWQVRWSDVGGQPARATLWADPGGGSGGPTAAADVPATGPRTQRSTPPASTDVVVTEELAVQIGADGGAVEFDSINAPSSLTYVVIEDIPPEPDVLVIDIDYDPRSLTVQAGDTVVWAWQGRIPHDVRSNGCGDGTGSCLFDSGVLTATPDLGTRFSHTFPEPGTYPYYCSVHSTPDGTAHNGVIVVE